MTARGKSPGGFGHSRMGASVLYLPAEGPLGAWLVDGFRLHDLNTETIGDLPARFDWSIMGWTILLLALMNLKKIKKTGKRMEGEERWRTKTVNVLLKTRSGRNRWLRPSKSWHTARKQTHCQTNLFLLANHNSHMEKWFYPKQAWAPVKP